MNRPYLGLCTFGGRFVNRPYGGRRTFGGRFMNRPYSLTEASFPAERKYSTHSRTGMRKMRRRAAA